MSEPATPGPAIEHARRLTELIRQSQILPHAALDAAFQAWIDEDGGDFGAWLEQTGRISRTTRIGLEQVLTQLAVLRDLQATHDSEDRPPVGGDITPGTNSTHPTSVPEQPEEIPAEIRHGFELRGSRPSDGTVADGSASRPTQVPTSPGHPPSRDGHTRLDAPEPYFNHPLPGHVADRARFRAFRFHAKGGLGVVYEAHDAELNRKVALKEIQEQHAFRASSRSRFTIEAEVTGRLEHPGIVPVYGLGQHADGRPFYAMRFIQGESLDADIRQYHDAGEREAPDRIRTFQNLLRRFLDVCNTIEYAHSRGVIHRDIKPANIMLGKYGETIVVDWGLARLRESGSDPHEGQDDPITPESLSSSTDTVAGQLIGTIRYMSPEQAAGRLDELGPASDVFSLGATLFMLLTGSHPMSEDDSDTALERLATGRIPSTREVRPDVAVGLDAICRKAMAPRPSDRYASPLGLAADLERWMADQPIEALAETLSSRVARWTRRHRQATLSAGLALITITLVSIIFAFFFNYERSRADREATMRLNALEKEKEARAEAEAGRKVQADLTKRAQTESDKVIQVVGLLVNTFRANDPIGLEGIGVRGGFESAKDLTAPVILERSVKEVESGLNDLPQVQATLLDTMGDIFRTMIRFERAEPLLTRALAIRQKELGPDHPDTATSLLHLGALRQDQTHYLEALDLFERALAIREKHYTRQGLLTVDVLLRIGLLKTFMGERKDALSIYKEVIEVRTRALGADHREVALARLGLATVLIDQEQIVPAMLESARAMRVLLSREDSARISKAIADFQRGFTFWKLGQHGLAERALRDGMSEARAALGPDHPYLALFYHQIAEVETDRGNLTASLENHRATVDLMRRSVGLHHPRARNAVATYGLALVKAEQGDVARRLYDELIREHTQVYGAEHPWIAECLVGLADVLKELKDFEAEQAALDRAIAIYQKPSRISTDNHARALSLRAMLLPMNRREDLIRRSIAIGEKELSPDNWMVTQARFQLLRTLVMMGKVGDETVALHQRLLRIMERPIDYRLQDHYLALELGAMLMLRRNDLSAAEHYVGKARDYQSKGSPLPVFQATRLDLLLATIRLSQGKPEDSIRILERALSLLIRSPDGTDRNVSERIESLALTRLAIGDQDGFRRDAFDMIRRFGRSSDSLVFARVLYMAARLPESALPDQDLRRLLRDSFRMNANGLLPRARALAYCRLGQPREAVDQLMINSRASVVNAFDFAIGALAWRANGNPTLARSLLDRARTDRNLPGWAWPSTLDLDTLIRQVSPRVDAPPIELPDNVFAP